MKTLVAGIGNIFFGDDAFGPEAIKLLGERSLGEDVRAVDFGIRGMHLALEMLEPYDRVVLVDAIARDDAPGTLFLIEIGICHREVSRRAPEGASVGEDRMSSRPDNDPEVSRGAIALDPHAMSVQAVLTLYERLSGELGAARRPEIFIVGCVPESTDEGMQLSEPVRAALPRCVELIEELVCARELLSKPSP